MVAVAKKVFPELKQCREILYGHRVLHSSGERGVKLDETLQRSAD